MKVNDNIYDKALHYIGRNKKDAFVVIIGAMDGISFDETRGYIAVYNWKGLFVEPIKEQFNKLVNVYSGTSGCLFENSAVSDKNGTVKMLRINNEAINKGLVHECFGGMSAIYPPRNGLASEGDKQTVEKYGEFVEVDSITLPTLFEKHSIKQFDIISIDTEGHDYVILKQLNFKKHSPKVVRIEYINLTQKEQKDAVKLLEKNGYVYNIIGQNLDAVKKEFWDEVNGNVEAPLSIAVKEPEKMFEDITLVTGLWNIGRNNLKEGWSRNYDHYLEKFSELLKTPYNLVIFGDEELEQFVLERRSISNTQFIKRDLSFFTNTEFFNKIQEIRKNDEWLNQAGWLRESTQARLEMYNPLVTSKMFLLNDARLLSKFKNNYMFWVDAGLTNTVHWGYFTEIHTINNLKRFFNKFSFVCFPYEAVNEIHGFKFDDICKIAKDKVKLVGRGGFFGGPVSTISNINSLYYNILKSTLEQGLMGTEESIFSILVYLHGDLVNYFEIEDNGLINKFFEDLKNDRVVAKSKCKETNINVTLNTDNTALYVLTYNSPKQFATLIKSMAEYDCDFLEKPQKFLLDNSTNKDTLNEYLELCKKYKFTHIKKDNIGICGGRQFIAEHADSNNFDFHLFFEDDMFFYCGVKRPCKNGFNRIIPNLYINALEITKNYGLDFLKLSFTEFFGDNTVQWTWYNVPQAVREKVWPHKSQLPVTGTDPNAPKTKFNNIISYKGIPFATGEIYYCNWPQVVTKEGNKKMFLTTKWAHPFEQTWMSYIFQENLKGNINGGVLLASPTEHNRFEYYKASERREN